MAKALVYCDDPPEMVMTWPAQLCQRTISSNETSEENNDVPLTQPPSSEARKATTRATSSGVAQRFSGQCSAMSFSILSAGQSGVPPGM